MQKGLRKFSNIKPTYLDHSFRKLAYQLKLNISIVKWVIETTSLTYIIWRREFFWKIQCVRIFIFHFKDNYNSANYNFLLDSIGVSVDLFMANLSISVW